MLFPKGKAHTMKERASRNMELMLRMIGIPFGFSVNAGYAFGLDVPSWCGREKNRPKQKTTKKYSPIAKMGSGISGHGPPSALGGSWDE